MKFTFVIYTLYFFQSIAYSQQNIPDSSSNLLIYFDSCFFVVKENGDDKKTIVSQGVSKTEQYKFLSQSEQENNTQVFQKAKRLIQSKKSKISFQLFDEYHYSVSPSVEHVFWKGNEVCSDYKKKVYNLLSGDSLEINTSDYEFNFSMLRYAWSPNGQWLAVRKEDKGRDLQSGGKSSIHLVNLSKNEITRTIKLDEAVEGITWDYRSGMVAILAVEWLKARTIGNFISPWAWFHPQMVQTYYVYLITPENGVLKKIKIADRSDFTMSYGMYWKK